MIHFSHPLLSSSIVPSNFLLRSDGADNIFDTADDVVFDSSRIEIRQVEPDVVHLELGSPMAIDQYRLTLIADSANPLRSTTNRLLDDGIDRVHFFQISQAVGAFETNDSLAEATVTGLDGSGTVVVTGDLGDGFFGAIDVDLFVVDVPSDAVLRVDVDAHSIGSSLDPTLVLFDNTGRQLVIDDDTDGLDSLIEYRVPVAGEYFIGVSGSPNFSYHPQLPGSGIPGSVGSYELHVTLEAGSEVRGTVWADMNLDGTRDPNEPGLAGVKLFADLNNNGQLDAVANTHDADDVPQRINLFIPNTIESSLQVTAPMGEVSDIDVKLNLRHTWDGDIIVTLLSPSGTAVRLFSNVGSSGRNFSRSGLLFWHRRQNHTSGSAPKRECRNTRR